MPDDGNWDGDSFIDAVYHQVWASPGSSTRKTPPAGGRRSLTPDGLPRKPVSARQVTRTVRDDNARPAKTVSQCLVNMMITGPAPHRPQVHKEDVSCAACKRSARSRPSPGAGRPRTEPLRRRHAAGQWLGALLAHGTGATLPRIDLPHRFAIDCLTSLGDRPPTA